MNDNLIKNSSLIRKAIDQMFPDFDDKFKDEINSRISGHFLQTIKEEIFKDRGSLEYKFDSKFSSTAKTDEQSFLYGEELGKELLLLPGTRQKEIADIIDKELARVMHELNVAYG